MVKVIRIHRFGGPEVLEVEDVDLAAPGPQEVRIAQGAIGLNYIDVYQRAGTYPNPLPLIPGNEAAGEVVAVGSEVDGVQTRRSCGLCGYARRLCRGTAHRGAPSRSPAVGHQHRGRRRHDAERPHDAIPSAPDLQGCARRHDPGPGCGRGGRAPALPVGQGAWRDRDRHRGQRGESRAGAGQWRPSYDPLSRRRFRGTGQGDHRRQTMQCRVRRCRPGDVSAIFGLPAAFRDLCVLRLRVGAHRGLRHRASGPQGFTLRHASQPVHLYGSAGQAACHDGGHDHGHPVRSADARASPTATP